MDYKKPVVNLIGQDVNAFFIIGRVISALKKAGASKEIQNNFRKEAMSGDYNNLLRVCTEYVEVE